MKSLVLAVFVIVAHLGFAARDAAAQLPEQAPPPMRPDIAVFGGNDRNWVRVDLSAPQSVYGHVTYDLLGKNISIKWNYLGSDGKPLFSIQNEAVRFWPTEVSSLGTNELLVAGVSTLDGSILIEKWTFGIPSPFPVARIDQATGELIEPMHRFNVVSRTAIKQIANETPVYRMFARRGLQGRALVQFHGSRHVYDLDLATGAMSILFAATTNGSSSVVPALLEVGVNRKSGNHVDEGYVYVVGELPSGDALYLFDQNRDGVIESQLVLTLAEARALMLTNGSKYLNFY